MNVQDLIESGSAWMLEGHVGRQCMAAIESGFAVLGTTRHRDYWGNLIPSRFDVVKGTKGSQAYAHDMQDHPAEYVTCRRGTCGLRRTAPKE